MKTQINIFTTEWCNLIFEGKNKNYGAYELRQMSAKRHVLAILLSVSIFVLGMSAPILLTNISPSKSVTLDERIVISDLHPKEPSKVELPLTPPPPQLRKTIRFVAPVVTNETEKEEDPPIIDIIKSSPTAIGKTNQDGIDDPKLPLPNLSAVDKEPDPVIFVEQMPEFPGGEAARAKFMRDNMKYPSIAAEMGISGRVILQFVVDRNGNIDRIKVLRGIGAGCDEEAMRVIKMMPPWRAGRQNGKCVPVYFTFPVVFALQNQ